MKRTILALAITLAYHFGAHAQILYSISGNGLQAPSYVLGTEHFASVSFVDSIPGIRAAMAATEQVYGELEMANMTSPENLQKLQQAMMLPEGTTLLTLLTPEEQSRLNVLLKDLMGFDLTNQMMAQQLGRLTPQALQTQLSLLIFLKRHPDFDAQHQFDSYFQEEAKKQGKSVGGFETLDYQIGVLFNGMSMERQKQLLMCLVDNRESVEQTADNIVTAFYGQNLDEIESALNEKKNNECDNSAEEENKLIYDRNANWMKEIPAVMAAKPTLFVVGAGHLPGDRGVLQLLRNAGYKVEGVK